MAGIRPSQIPDQAARAGWPPKSAAEWLDMVDQARQLLRKDAETDLPTELAVALARYRDLYARCRAIQDYKSAMAAQREIDRIVARLTFHADNAGE